MAHVELRVLAQRAFRSRSPAATEVFGALLARALEAEPELARAGVALALEGELGAGKTAVVRGVARGLGSPDTVHSPSFTLMHTYAGRLPIYHFDAWMEGRERAFLEGGGAEWLDGGGLALVEWSSRVEGWLPLPRLGLLLEHMGVRDPEHRRLTLRALAGAGGGGPRGRLLESLVRGLRVADAPEAAGGLEDA